MAHDWKRCKALAVDLVLATRDMGCDPDIIATHNITDAFGHVAQTLLGMGIPAPTVIGALRYRAECVDAVARDDAEQKASARRPRLVLVHDRDEDTPQASYSGGLANLTSPQPRTLFAAILRLIAELRPPPDPAPA